MGKNRVAMPKKKAKFIGFKTTEALYDKVLAEADSDGRTVSSFVRNILEKRYAEKIHRH